ncbi:MAG TPA: protoporphyrinogen oxidase HemJ [Rhizomicrobium sp.]|jgi:putative membrane protein|nr:protoporphyrinogen oxidase HemJ [Rhizomicrobium sp.]
MDDLRNLLADYIPWFLAAHIIAVIAWMSGMLYLPRLFVYHTQVQPGTPESERFKVMERKLLRGITNPAMIAVWILGPLLAWLTSAYLDTWLHIKFALVIVLSAVHGYLVSCFKAFARDANTHSERFYRILNEVPAVLMVLIVILVVVQPFGG